MTRDAFGKPCGFLGASIATRLRLLPHRRPPALIADELGPRAAAEPGRPAALGAWPRSSIRNSPS